MSRHAHGWTLGRMVADRFLGRTVPGKHHPIWVVRSDNRLITDPEAFDRLALRMFGDGA